MQDGGARTAGPGRQGAGQRALGGGCRTVGAGEQPRTASVAGEAPESLCSFPPASGTRQGRVGGTWETPEDPVLSVCTPRGLRC